MVKDQEGVLDTMELWDSGNKRPDLPAMLDFVAGKSIIKQQSPACSWRRSEKEIFTWCYREPVLVILQPCKVSNPTKKAFGF